MKTGRIAPAFFFAQNNKTATMRLTAMINAALTALSITIPIASPCGHE
jgi:hypothetical protein